MPKPIGLFSGFSRPDSREGSRGQVAVIFAMSIVLFVALCAVVVDIAFFWVTSLRVQRAADSAALAGAVYLPGDPSTAYSEARASATQNDYTGGTGVTVTPIQDSMAKLNGDPRQLDVTITASSPAFFARVVGISSFPITRSSKGVYVLPVPMGSPLAYYGVGDFSANESTTKRTDYMDVSVPGYTSNAAPPTNWGTPNNGWANGTANYATASSNNLSQIWSTLKIPAISGAVLDGVALSFNAKVATVAAACQVKAEISWGGTNWGNAALTTPTMTVANNTTYTLGSPTAMSVWGNNHTWASGDFANANFKVRLTYLKGSGCGNLSLNTLLVTVYSHTTTTTTVTKTTLGVSDGGTFLASQGGWGAIITKGGSQGNGDAYAPGTAVKYDPTGYNYVIGLPSGGSVKVFDPGFCAMGSNGVAGSLGAGDHWIAGNTGTSAPVSTYYTLWNSNGKPGMPGSWTEMYTSGTKFEDQTGYDPANMGVNGTGSPPANATSGCDAYHNTWWTLPSGPLGAGTYILQVQTTKTGHPVGGTGANADASKNSNTNAENMWSIEAAGGGAQVYGNGRMTVYNNLQATPTPQQFYLAKIDQQTGAGKTALIDLFDPGDLCGSCDGTLQVFSPDGGSSHAVNFNYETDANCVNQPGTSPCGKYSNVSQFVTTKAGKQATNNTWIHISIPLPSTYGSGGLWQGGWWQIVYTTPGGGNDTTTWEVSVSGNPVHLLVP
jgi:Flp pilus assembly protein TadG